jgi:hypothetical protein
MKKSIQKLIKAAQNRGYVDPEPYTHVARPSRNRRRRPKHTEAKPDWDGTPPEQHPQAIPVDETTVRRIPLTRGYVALVDADKYDALVKIPWRAKVNKKFRRVDAVAYGSNRMLAMHRRLLNAPADMFVDHFNARGGLMADGTTIDNRECNLRLATNAQNQHNTGRPASNTSGYKGVARLANGTYTAHITVDKQPVHVGTYDTLEAAANAYDAAALVLHDREFVRLNLTDGDTWIDFDTLKRIMNASPTALVQVPLPVKNSSGHKGVYWINHYQKWKATYRRKHGKQVHVGMYDTMEEAIQARATAITQDAEALS